MGFVRNLAAIAAAFAAVSYTPAVVEGCTEFMLWDSIPDQIVTVRTVDFNADLLAKIVKVPRGVKRTTEETKPCPACKMHSWEGKYGYVYLNWLDSDLASDGMNERGLSVSTLLQKWTPDYPEPNPADPRPACAVQSVSHFILSTCTTIAEVKEALNSIQTVNYVSRWDALVGQLPTHLAVTDREGNQLVVEWTNNGTASPACLNTTAILPDGKICVYDNSKYRAIVNEPSFEEQTKIVDGWFAKHGKPANWDGVFADLKGDWRGVTRLARLVTLNELSYENQGSWLTPTGVNPLPVAYSQFTFAFEELEAKPALMACIAAAAPASPEPTIIDGNKAYSLFVAELDRQLKATENPRNLTAAEVMASINSDTGLNTTEFGAVVASVAHLPASAQEHLIEFPTTFVNQSPNLDAINRAIAIVSSIALPPGSNTAAGMNGATIYTVVRDHTNLLYYYRTPGNMGLQYVDLATLNFLESETRVDVNVNQDRPYRDLSPRFSAANANLTDADYDGAGAVIPPPPVCVTNGNKTTGGEIGIMVMIAILAVLGTAGGSFMGYRMGKRHGSQGNFGLSSIDLRQRK